jgi:hypothetical protein
VVHSRSILGQELGHASALVSWLDQFNLALTRWQECDHRLLAGDILNMVQVQTQGIPPEMQSFINIVYSDCHMIDLLDRCHLIYPFFG